MKKRNNAFARLVGLLLVSATVLTLTVAATGGAGTSSDPLVTLSYLNEKFLPQILSEVDKKTASREQTLSSKLTEQVKSETQAFEQKYGASSGNASGGTAASFTVVTLNQGQILYMGVGCEAMLRTGSGVCVAASTPGPHRRDVGRGACGRPRFAEESPLHGDGRQPRRAGERKQHKAARTRQLQRAVKSLHKEKSLCIEIAQALYFVPDRRGERWGTGKHCRAARFSVRRGSTVHSHCYPARWYARRKAENCWRCRTARARRSRCRSSSALPTSEWSTGESV